MYNCTGLLVVTYKGYGIQCQVGSVAELATDCQVSEDRVHIFAVPCCRRSLEMFNVLAQTNGFPCRAERLLHGLPWLDGGCCGIGAVQVPGVEAGKVLECSEELVTTDCECGLALSMLGILATAAGWVER